jgi:elongation factor G
VERSLRVLDGAIAVFCGVAGVEAQSETVWRQAERYGVPCLAFVNKLDRVGADFARVVSMIRERLNARPVPLTWPVGTEKEFVGVLDVLDRKVYVFSEEDQGRTWREEPVPADLSGLADELHHAIVEAASESSDELMSLYLEEKPLTREQILQGLRSGTLARKIIPTFAGSAFKNKGVQMLLDGVCRYLPSPLDLPPIEGEVPGTKDAKVLREPKEDAPVTALAFKSLTDAHGELTFLRIYSGAITSGLQLWNPRRNRTERIGRLYLLHANEREAIERGGPGSIVGVVGLKYTVTGDTLCPKDDPILLEGMAFPETVISLAIEPKTTDDRDKLVSALERISREDPTFRRRVDEETGQLILSGMGELHLEVVTHRLEREFKVGVIVGRPRVAYKQTIQSAVEAEGKLVKQTGGRGQYGHVVLTVEPNPDEIEPVFETKVVGGRVPREYIPAVEQGVRAACESGGTVGYPIVNVKVTLIDGSAHSVDSSELAFSLAAEIAIKEAMQKGGVVILEPIMKFDVTVPNEFVRGVIADLGSRRTRITKLDLTQQPRIIRGFVPLSEMFGYSTVLRSLTQGRAAFTMEPAEYAPLPGNLAKELTK